jgi:hypothetical protein
MEEQSLDLRMAGLMHFFFFGSSVTVGPFDGGLDVMNPLSARRMGSSELGSGFKGAV